MIEQLGKKDRTLEALLKKGKISDAAFENQRKAILEKMKESVGQEKLRLTSSGEYSSYLRTQAKIDPNFISNLTFFGN